MPFQKGHPNYNLRVSEKTKKKLSKINTGKKMSDVAKKKMSESAIKRVKRIGINPPHPTGIKHYNWKGGITPTLKKIRASTENRLWREAVFARDNFTCQKDNIKGCRLCAHHIKNFIDYPELRFAIDNGITISKQAHTKFHNRYGYRNNSKKQLEKFLKS